MGAISEGRKVGQCSGVSVRMAQRWRSRCVRGGQLCKGPDTCPCVCVHIWVCKLGLGICLTLLDERETFLSWKDQKVDLFSVELNQEEQNRSCQ